MPISAKRLNQLPTYFFEIIAQRIQKLKEEGADIISLDIGSPDMPPPSPVVESLADSARQPNTHGYAGYRGIPAFRKSVANYYEKRFGVTLDPEREILPLIGSKEGIINLSLAYLDSGDSALVPDISYPSYSMGAKLAGAEVHWVPVNVENNFVPTVSSLEGISNQNTKLLWVNFPNNPTGATTDISFYDEMVDWCIRHDILLASDNPYVDVTFDQYRAPSALQAHRAKQCTVEFMSFSKTFNMGGWRLGAAVGNAEALKTLLQVKSNVDSGHFRPIYEAGITALETTPQSWIDNRNAIYQHRRDRIMETLPQIGLEAQLSKGSLYIWARVREGNGDAYIERALNEAHVAFAPGSAYGPGGKQYVRISLGVADSRLEIALQRLRNWHSS